MTLFPGFDTPEELEYKKRYIIAEGLIVLQWPSMTRHKEDLREMATIIADSWDEMAMDDLIEELTGK